MGKRRVPKFLETGEKYEVNSDFLQELMMVMLLALQERGYICENQLQACLEKLKKS